MRALKEHSDRPLEVDNNQLRGSLKLIPLQLHKKLPKDSMSTILWLFSIWSKLERWQSSISGCPMSRLKVKKALFWSIFSYSMQQKPTISRSDYDMWWKVNFVPQLAMASSVVGPRRSSKALPKAKLAPKEGHGHCLVVCGLSDPLRLSESQQNHYIWEQCSANWWDAPKTATPEAGTGQRKGPGSAQQFPTAVTERMLASKVTWIGLWRFCLLCHIHRTSHQSQLPTTSPSISTTFFRRGNASTTSRRQKVFSKSSSNLQAQLFTLQE